MHNVVEPETVKINWEHTFRAIPSKFPPINFFEDLVDPTLMEELFYVESLTNDRLRDEIGDIFLVPSIDRISGVGSSIVMAAFTHISKDRPSRFSDGTFGIYYAAKTIETALKEKAFHSARFLAYTHEAPGAITLRVYQSKKIVKPLKDIRNAHFQNLHDSDNYSSSQHFGLAMKQAQEWGIVYRSVRHFGGDCVAILRPTAISLPVNQTKHFNLEWDGHKITQAYEVGGNVLAIS